MDDRLSVIFDADGVLLEFTEHALQLVGSDRTREDVTQWDIFSLFEKWHGTDAKRLLIEACNGPGFWASQPAMPGAKDAIELTRSLGFRPVIATSPWDGCDRWESVRRRVLADRFGVHPFKDVVPTADKTHVHGVAIIEDRFDNMSAWHKKHNGTAWLYDQPYNRHNEWHQRLRWDLNLGDFGRSLEAIRDRLAR